MWLRPSITFYGDFSLAMDRSPGFGPSYTDSGTCHTWFPSGSGPEVLNLACIRSSPDRSTKSTRLYSIIVLPQLEDTGFQVLFHSPPGVLFTFPSRYSSLSVTEEYLALRSGPRMFTQDSTCLVLLWILLPPLHFRVRDFHALRSRFPTVFC